MEKGYYLPSKTLSGRNSSPQHVGGSPCGDNNEFQSINILVLKITEITLNLNSIQVNKREC